MKRKVFISEADEKLTFIYFLLIGKAEPHCTPTYAYLCLLAMLFADPHSIPKIDEKEGFISEADEKLTFIYFL